MTLGSGGEAVDRVNRIDDCVHSDRGDHGSATAVPAWRRVLEGDFHQTVARWLGPTLVLFGQAGCGACQRAVSLVPQAQSAGVPHLLWIDAAEQAGLAREFEVFHLPALHLFIDGRYHAPINCELTVAALRTAVAAAMAAPAVEAP